MKHHKMVTLGLIAMLSISMLATMGASAAVRQAGALVRQASRRGSPTFPTKGTGVGSLPASGIDTHELPPDPDSASGATPIAGAQARSGRRAQRTNRSYSRRPDPNAAQQNSQLAGIQPDQSISAPQVNSNSSSNSSGGLSKSFDGLNSRDQRLANGANQFSVEPPDQGLCAGNGFVLETVNTVLRAYDTQGKPVSGVVDLNTFYGYPAQFDRTTLKEGPFMTDPSCYYDTDTKRWFHIALTLAVDEDTGALLGPNSIDIAVSNTSSPVGDWTIYSVPVQDDGTDGTPSHTDCPCIGDYPHLGADKYGFYVTTNEYPLSTGPGQFGNNFNGAQLYAFSKKALTSLASTVAFAQFENLISAAGDPGFTVWPALSPGGKYADNAHGTEYFLSSSAGEEALNATGVDNRIVLWALTNTRSLDSSLAVSLSNTVLNSEVYGVPPLSEQKSGNIPLRDCLLVICRSGLGNGPYSAEVEGALDSNDSRMQQVIYADGKVWGALDTIININGNFKAGIAYFIVKPNVSGSGDVTGKIRKQGYVGVANNNVNYPAIGLLPNGTGIMAFTLVGSNYYPSAAYASIDANGVGKIRVAAAGAGPQDGFSGYKFFNDPDPVRPRWGDYGATATDGKNIWFASEYIAHTCTFAQFNADIGCGGTRVTLTNWATRVSSIKP